MGWHPLGNTDPIVRPLIARTRTSNPAQSAENARHQLRGHRCFPLVHRKHPCPPCRCRIVVILRLTGAGSIDAERSQRSDPLLGSTGRDSGIESTQNHGDIDSRSGRVLSSSNTERRDNDHPVTGMAFCPDHLALDVPFCGVSFAFVSNSLSVLVKSFHSVFLPLLIVMARFRMRTLRLVNLSSLLKNPSLA